MDFTEKEIELARQMKIKFENAMKELGLTRTELRPGDWFYDTELNQVRLNVTSDILHKQDVFLPLSSQALNLMAGMGWHLDGVTTIRDKFPPSDFIITFINRDLNEFGPIADADLWGVEKLKEWNDSHIQLMGITVREAIYSAIVAALLREKTHYSRTTPPGNNKPDLIEPPSAKQDGADQAPRGGTP